jgi:DNA-binding transcriptional LysR family regulator
MRFEDLRVFALAAKAGTLHGAAQNTGTTQSAVTKTVQRLEAEFGLRLMNRSRRGIELTTAGQALLVRALAVELSVTDIQTEMAAIKSAETGAVRIGTIPALLETTLIPLMTQSRRRRPDVLFHVRVQTSARLIPAVQAGELDLALCPTTEDLPEDIQTEHVDQLRYHIVGRLGHPLAQGNANLQALAEAEWLLPPPNVAMRLSIEKFLAAAGFAAPRVVVEADTSTAWFAELIRQSDMVTAFTDLMMASRLGQGLQVLPFAPMALTNDLHIFYRRKAYLSPAVQDVRASLQAMLRHD